MIPTTSQRPAFRADVEGMRALAVLAILGFHFQWAKAFDGGFVGVDIFFVISGFLITGNLLRENDASSFTFRGFYLRRVRRLFPALFVAVMATLLCGIALSSPSDLIGLAESAIASTFSVANIYFWSKAGYFDAEAIQKPLLHIWSLSVEEQFYLFWPALIVLAYRMRRRAWLPAFMLAMTVVGVAAAEYQIRRDPSAAFFLTPFRVNEFALGAICAMLPPLAGRRFLRETLALAGIALMLYSIAAFTEQTAFPGLASMIPCGGAALVIYANGGAVSRALFTNPVAAYIGRISYSLYLVHWPITVFVFQWLGTSLGPAEKAAMTAGSLLLAAAMYHFVEQPFRFSRGPARVRITNPAFAAVFLPLICAAAVLSVAIIRGDGWPSRYSVNSARIADDVTPEKEARQAIFEKICSGRRCDAPYAHGNVFLLGDSHTADILNAMASAYPRFHYVYEQMGACKLLTRRDYGVLPANHPRRAECLALNERRLYGGQLKKADLVVINQLMYDWYTPEIFARVISQIRTKTHAPIVVLGNYLVFQVDFPSLVIKHDLTVMDDFYRQRLSDQTFLYDDRMAALAARMKFTYVSKRRAFCRNDSVLSCPIEFDGKLFTYDRHHLSTAAAFALGRVLQSRYGDLFARVPVASAGPAQKPRIWFEPAGLSACASPAKVSVHWDARSYAGAGPVKIFAVNKVGKEVLFARAGRLGNRDTGSWMSAGSRMVLRDQSGAKELASATVASLPCRP